MKKLVWVYVSHPYTGDEERNRAEAAEIQRFLQERDPDMLFLNPIAMFAAVADMEYEQVMEYCLEVLRDCDMIVMSGEFMDSRGCTMEHTTARELGIPIRYYLDKEEPLETYWA